MTEKKLIKLGLHDQLDNCRFYEQKYPDMEEFVMVRVKNITDTAAYVQLLEYNNAEGMVPLSELSRRRIRSVNKHIRVGKTEIVQVFRLDREKGYIDLSKKKVKEEDARACESRYTRAKDVHSVMQHVARECKIQLESLYNVVGWPLYKKYGHAYDGFGDIIVDPEKALSFLNFDEEVKEKLISTIRHRHKAQPFRIRSDVEVTCFKYEGVDSVREALMAGEKTADGKEIAISIRLLAAPIYVIVANSVGKEDGLAAVAKATKAIQEVIEAKGGNLKVVKAPTIVSTDELRTHTIEGDEEGSESGGEEEGEEEEEEEDEDDDEDNEDDEEEEA